MTHHDNQDDENISPEDTTAPAKEELSRAAATELWMSFWDRAMELNMIPQDSEES